MKITYGPDVVAIKLGNAGYDAFRVAGAVFVRDSNGGVEEVGEARYIALMRAGRRSSFDGSCSGCGLVRGSHVTNCVYVIA